MSFILFFLMLNDIRSFCFWRNNIFVTTNSIYSFVDYNKIRHSYSIDGRESALKVKAKTFNANNIFDLKKMTERGFVNRFDYFDY